MFSDYLHSNVLRVVIGVCLISDSVLSRRSSRFVSSTFEKGIDVSHYQGTVDWARVKAAGISFVIAKATEGDTYEDPTYQQNCQGMQANGLKSGAYHYLLGSVPAKAQVANIVRVLGPCKPDVLAIDVEEGRNTGISPTKMADVLKGVLDGLRDSFSNIYIYTGPNYWENKVDWRKYDFSDYKLWIAHYTTTSPTIPTTWRDKGYTWWQYSDKGRVDGVGGLVDLDRAK